jgi:hypothetical protein
MPPLDSKPPLALPPDRTASMAPAPIVVTRSRPPEKTVSVPPLCRLVALQKAPEVTLVAAPLETVVAIARRDGERAAGAQDVAADRGAG